MNRELVQNPDIVLKKLISEQGYAARALTSDEFRKFESNFFLKHQIKINFSEAAVEEVIKRSEISGLSIYSVCENSLTGYEYGLSLVSKNSGRSEFEIPVELIRNPQKVLEDWIRESCHQFHDPSRGLEPSVSSVMPPN